MATKVWEQRFWQLRTVGLTYDQASVVYDLLNEAHAFGSQTIADSAKASMDEVYAKYPA